MLLFWKQSCFQCVCLGWAEGPASFYVLTTVVAASAADASLARAYQGLNGGLADDAEDGL